MESIIKWTGRIDRLFKIQVLGKEAVQKKIKKHLAVQCTEVYTDTMPNQPALDRTQLVMRIERGLKKQLDKEAKRLGITVTQLVERILNEELSGVELTPEDYRAIAEDMERERKKRFVRKS